MNTLRTDLSVPETLGVVLLCFGLPIVGSMAVMFKGFQVGSASDASLLSTVLFELVVSGLALLFLRWRGYAVRTLWPEPSRAGVLAGLLICAMSLGLVMSVNQVLATEADANHFNHFMHDGDLSWQGVVPMALVNGTFEEVFLLGVLARGLRRHGVWFAYSVSLLVRALYHTYQGPLGVVDILLTGSIFSLFHMRFQVLFPVVFAHILWDVIPFLL